AELKVPGAKPAAEAPKFPSTAATLPDALAGVPDKKPEPVSTMRKPPAAAARPAQDTQSGRRQKKRRSRAAQRFLVDRMLPMAFGILGMLLLYELILPLFPVDHMIRVKMTQRGWVPWVCTAMLFWHLSYVLIRHFLRVRPEYSVLGRNIIPASALEVTDDDLQQISQRCVEVENAGGSLLTKRILLAVAHLGISRDTAELGDLLRRRADADRARAATAYLMPKFLAGGIPLFGFVGTVIGISAAIKGLEALQAGADATEGMMSKALSFVAANLSVAFDTTLIGLVMSIAALLVQTLVQRQESQLLADIEDYLTYRLQSRIRTETHDVRIEKILRQALDDMKTLQQQMSEEQGERSTVTLQTMVTANDALREAMGSMPEMIKEVGDSSAGLMEGTRDKLDEVVMNIKQSLSSGIAEVVERLEGAVEKQADMGKQTMEVMEEDAKRLGEQLGVGFQDATGTLDESLHGMLDKLSNILSDGKEITTLQEAIRSNLDELARVQNLNDTFVEVRGSLDSLKPVLETLNKPIPLKLTFGGVEIEGANKTSDSFDL
ncbi:MAG: MotA/TolQ/ExbB proton channel family protein, partial [Planctomycetota bacterium]